VSRAVFPLLAYACLLSALAVMPWVWDDHWLPPTMLSVAAGAMTATAGVWVVQARRLARAGDAPDVRAVPDLSAATALLGFAIPTALVGFSSARRHCGSWRLTAATGRSCSRAPWWR
jgi:ABC-type glycerol-3-phosphate transport system permease component